MHYVRGRSHEGKVQNITDSWYAGMCDTSYRWTSGSARQSSLVSVVARGMAILGS